MKKLILILTLSLSFGFCFAPINRGIVPPDQIQRELSEAQRTQQQNNLPQIGNVGGVDGGNGVSAPGSIGNDPEAAKTMAQAMSTSESMSLSDRAKQDLAVATNNMTASQSGNSLIVWAVVLGMVGFGIVYGARKWADKVIPQQPAMARTKSSKW